MGILQGSVSLCRYRLVGSKGKASIGRLSELLEPHKSGPLLLDGIGKEELVGWVRPGVDGLDLPPDAAWDLSHCLVENEGFFLRMRSERRAVPASLLQLIYKQEFHKEETRNGKTPGPKARRELRDRVKTELMARALPAIAHVDAFWRDRQGELTLFTTGKKARTTFETLFQTTFAGPLELTLVRIDPPLMGLPSGHWEDSLVASETLGRLSLTTPVAFTEQLYP